MLIVNSRPRTVDEVAHQDEVVAVLKKTLQSNDVGGDFIIPISLSEKYFYVKAISLYSCYLITAISFSCQTCCSTALPVLAKHQQS